MIEEKSSIKIIISQSNSKDNEITNFDICSNKKLFF